MSYLHKICFKNVRVCLLFPTLCVYFIDWVESWKTFFFFFFVFHPKSLRINANCILRYQGNFSSCALTVFHCAPYRVLGVIFLIWVKPMQDINCVLLLVLALLFNPAMYECPKKNTTNKTKQQYIPLYIVCETTNMWKIHICQCISGHFWGLFKKSIGLFLPQHHFKPDYCADLARRVILMNSYL